MYTICSSTNICECPDILCLLECSQKYKNKKKDIIDCFKNKKNKFSGQTW